MIDCTVPYKYVTNLLRFETLRYGTVSYYGTVTYASDTLGRLFILVYFFTDVACFFSFFFSFNQFFVCSMKPVDTEICVLQLTNQYKSMK